MRPALAIVPLPRAHEAEHRWTRQFGGLHFSSGKFRPLTVGDHIRHTFYDGDSSRIREVLVSGEQDADLLGLPAIVGQPKTAPSGASARSPAATPLPPGTATTRRR